MNTHSAINHIGALERVRVQHIPRPGPFSRSRWRLTDELRMGPHGDLRVPAGFITDGVTVPLWMFLVVKPTGVLFEPAVLHDFILSTLKPTDSRKTADDTLRLECTRYGASWFKSGLIWSTVRIYGIVKVTLARARIALSRSS